MKWSTHKAIARALANMLGIYGVERDILVEGCIKPDIEKDYVTKVGRRGRVYTAPASHHNASKSLIMKYVWMARRYYLIGDTRRAMDALGRALHYIHDRTTGKGFLGLFHGKVEEKLVQEPVNREAIKKGIDDAVPSPVYIEKMLRKAKSSNNSKKSMERACYLSGLVSKAVLWNKYAPRELIEKYNRLKERNRKVVIPLAIVSGFASYIALLLYTGNPLISFMGWILTPVAYSLDLSYRRCKKELKWFLTRLPIFCGDS